MNELSRAINVNPSLARVLVQRGIRDFESAKSFFRPDVSQIHDPFLMKDMDLAVNRLQDALSNNEKILIYGDYDVDGTTSVALVFGFLSELTENIEFYINDREGEGYGVSEQGIEFADKRGVNLIITLDCGIKAGKLVEKATDLGIDFIICDHHTTGESLPAAVAVLDPKREDCHYPFQDLSGCGVGFKLLQGLCRKMEMDDTPLFARMDLLAVSVAADIVPIIDENRIFCQLGLKMLNQNPSFGLSALLDISGQEEINISGIVFGIAPRINAAGRISHAHLAVKLLLADNMEKAAKLSEKINSNNSLRRDFDSTITEEALQMIREEGVEKKTTVLFKEDWHKGVVGIVASRCIERFHRPTIILTGTNGSATGSARSIPGYNIYDAILECEDLLEKFGGHKYAAGLSMPVENVTAFKERFESVVSSNIPEELLIPPVKIDVTLDFDSISTNFVKVIDQMEPFGPGNMAPVFESKGVFVQHTVRVLKEKHIKFKAGQRGNLKTFDVIGFGLAGFEGELSGDKTFSMAYSIEFNTYNGNTQIQLRLKDIKFD